MEQLRVDCDLDRFGRAEEEMPVEAAEERHRLFGARGPQGGAGRLRGGVEEIRALEGSGTDLDVDELFGTE